MQSHDFLSFNLFMNIFYVPVVRNDISVYLHPNCSNQMLIHDVINYQCAYLHVPVCQMHSSFISFSYVGVKMLDKKSKIATCKFIYYFTVTAHMKRPKKFPRNLDNLSVNFP